MWKRYKGLSTRCYTAPSPNIVSAKCCCHLDCRMTLQSPGMTCVVLEPSVTRTLPQSSLYSTLRQLPEDSLWCHSTVYISRVTCPVSQSNLNLDQNESRRPKTPFKASIFCRGRKIVFTDVVKMTWQNWSELDHVSMVVLWKYSGRFKNTLEQCTCLLSWYISI